MKNRLLLAALLLLSLGCASGTSDSDPTVGGFYEDLYGTETEPKAFITVEDSSCPNVSIAWTDELGNQGSQAGAPTTKYFDKRIISAWAARCDEPGTLTLSLFNFDWLEGARVATVSGPGEEIGVNGR